MANDLEDLVNTPKLLSQNSSPQSSPKMYLEPKIINESSKNLIKLHPTLTAINYGSNINLKKNSKNQIRRKVLERGVTDVRQSLFKLEPTPGKVLSRNSH